MKLLTLNGFGAMKRWPRVSLPLLIPSISNGTTLPPNRQRIECIGRTQRNRPLPQRIDLGQGKLWTISGTILATTSDVGPAGPLDQRDIEVALLVGSRFGPIEGLQAGGFEKSLDGGVRRADAWAFALLAHIRRAGWQAINHHGQAARRGEAPSRVEAKPSLLQRIAEEAREIVSGARLHARRDLFAKQLEQKLSHERAGKVQA